MTDGIDAVLERRELATSLVAHALDAIDAQSCTRYALTNLAARGVDLSRCTVFAFGKAALGMARAALDFIEVSQGIVVCFESGRLGPLSLVRGGHPIPAADAPEHGEAILRMATALDEDDVALCLVSGGGSAMLERPKSGISMAQINETTRRLMREGANIGQLNAARTELSALKGGGLARAIHPARIVNVIISDVPGHGIETVASGPTLCDDPAIDIDTVIAADNQTARRAIVDAAKSRGSALAHIDAYFGGAASDAGAVFSTVGPGHVHGGETTVKVSGRGIGGRNQEFVLGALPCFQKGLLACIGTDGVDGNSDAAGAFIDELVVRQITERQLDAREALRNNDSGSFFSALDAQIITGLTGTNVADVAFYLG